MRDARKLTFALLLVAPTVMAQPGTPPPPPTTPPAAQGDVSVRQTAALSPDEMVRQSRDYRGRISEIVVRITGLVEPAKRERDIIRLNCLLERQKQGEVTLSIADQAITSLEDAIRRADSGGALHEYTRVTIVYQKAQVLSSEADACVGEELQRVGSAGVDMQVDPGIETGKTGPDTVTTPGLAKPPLLDRFTSLSPFK